MSQLILPAHVGDRRYGKQRPAAPAGVPDPANEQRPYQYQEMVGDRLVVVANAAELVKRMPLDEMRAMAREREKKRRARGDHQQRDDWAAVLREYWDDRRNAAWDRRNGRVSFSAATFVNTRHKGAR